MILDVPLWTNDAPCVPLPSRFCDSQTARRVTLSLRGLLDGRTWHSVVFSNYMTDIEWLCNEIPSVFDAASPTKVAFLWGDDHGAHAGALSGLEAASKLLWARKPHLPIPFGTHHTKAIFAFTHSPEDVLREHRDAGVRIAILSANFVLDDWHRKSQVLYAQDFPVRTSAAAATASPSHSERSGTDFREPLLRYLTVACGGELLPPLTALVHIDYSAASGKLIPSVPGYHSVDDARWGILRLRELLRDVPAPRGPKRLVWQFSSLGSLTEDFITLLTSAMMEQAASSPTQRAPPRPENEAVETTVQVVLPTQEEVRASVEGWRAGLSIPVTMKNIAHHFLRSRLYRFTPPHFFAPNPPLKKLNQPTAKPIPLFRECSGRHRTMPHLKSYMRITTSDSSAADWVVITSANLSRAAWGDPQKRGRQLMIRSFELGVLFTPSMPGVSESSFSLTPATPLLPLGETTAEDLGRLATEYGLFSVPLGSTNRALLLPYSPLHLQPYDSNAPLSDPSRASHGACRDIPWAVDFDHRGLDVLGQDASVLANYSHDWATAVGAPTLRWSEPTHTALLPVAGSRDAPLEVD